MINKLKKNYSIGIMLLDTYNPIIEELKKQEDNELLEDAYKLYNKIFFKYVQPYYKAYK